MLEPGLYENIINEKISKELSEISPEDKKIKPLEEPETVVVLAKYVEAVVKRALTLVASGKADTKTTQIALTNKIIDVVEQEISPNLDDSFSKNTISEKGEQLLAIRSKDPDEAVLSKSSASNRYFIRPDTSMAQTSLFTGARHEPQMFTELKKEIASADCICMLVSFIRWTGLRLILEDLRSFTERGGLLKIITTSYMGATELKAIEELNKLPNTEIKISYDTDRTRLHAKAYVFKRNTGLTTAYVGSSNMSYAALSSGLEWNLKITATDLPDLLAKILATFDNYWNASEFESYSAKMKDRLDQALNKSKSSSSSIIDACSFFDLQPYAFQQEILDKLEAERAIHKNFKNLIVISTMIIMQSLATQAFSALLRVC